MITEYLPIIFAALMGLSILIYVILDGYDLGIGILTITASEDERDVMVSAIGPFWDANETWLVLAIGILLTAFPLAHGEILGFLYIPVFFMLIGLIFRGVSFEFRAKANPDNKVYWDFAFFIGSLVTTLSQGYMLGMYIMGLEYSMEALLFSSVTSLILISAYCFIGSLWLVYKTKDELRKKYINISKNLVIAVFLGFGLISIITPIASERIAEKWFRIPEILALLPIPMMVTLLSLSLFYFLAYLKNIDNYKLDIFPFVLGSLLFILAFIGLAYSFYPYIIPDQMTIYEAAISSESLIIILYGTLFVLPTIICYTAVSYYIFRSKAEPLSYK